ncbi:GNAT family N-acetyltransferase [Leptospira wolffii]|uniref:GNAT family N-acetyltransferase n=1 Tax=Leptospira wolffii TaxID=409998 RepID=UPI0002FDC0CD|nr:GNAT family N-acetyltransferase [Leptospira wolffii]EPG66215.1 FR47-like protein [Leptospira wolffii serovar Khorat str. Khorat-H2]
MDQKPNIGLIDPYSSEAIEMMEALWIEIQTRYGFQAPNPMKPEHFIGPRYGFWIAKSGQETAGSVALVPWSQSVAELDVMYVDPRFRRSGIASLLVEALESFAKKEGFSFIRLRAGAPQPEALRFYEKQGYIRIESFGRWASDDTAWCYEKKILD